MLNDNVVGPWISTLTPMADGQWLAIVTGQEDTVGIVVADDKRESYLARLGRSFAGDA
jgi:hypothetical protein